MATRGDCRRAVWAKRRTTDVFFFFMYRFFVCVCLSRRVLKPRNYVAVTPSRQQVASQAAMESIPLVFEPRSRFYTSPVVVLDFQVSCADRAVRARCCILADRQLALSVYRERSTITCLSLRIQEPRRLLL